MHMLKLTTAQADYLRGLVTADIIQLGVALKPLDARKQPSTHAKLSNDLMLAVACMSELTAHESDDMIDDAIDDIERRLSRDLYRDNSQCVHHVPRDQHCEICAQSPSAQEIIDGVIADARNMGVNPS